MKRILVIGRSGAGKTTFSDRLGKALGRKVIHLDNLFWKPGWVRAFSSEEWVKQVKRLIKEDEWIIDGTYHNTLEMRLRRADTVIFFDINSFRSLLNALKRKHSLPSESADNVPRLHSEVGFLILVKSVFRFPSKKVYEQIKKSGVEKVYVIKNQKDSEKVLQKLTKDSL